MSFIRFCGRFWKSTPSRLNRKDSNQRAGARILLALAQLQHGDAHKIRSRHGMRRGVPPPTANARKCETRGNVQMLCAVKQMQPNEWHKSYIRPHSRPTNCLEVLSVLHL